MKKSNQKKTIKVFLILGTAIGLFFITNPKKQDSNYQEMAKAQMNNPDKTKTFDFKESKREPAAIKPKAEINTAKKNPPTDSRVILGGYDKKTEITLVNKVSDDWKVKYQKNFLRMAKQNEVKDFELIKKRSVLKVKNNLGRHLEHVLIRYKRPDGLPFSFEAYIDSETGQMVQSWNKTQFEFQKPYTFKAQGREYKSN